jgi:hypothetical protein
MTEKSFDTRLTNAENAVIEWFTKAGAEVGDSLDQDNNEFLDPELLGLRIGDIEIFIGEATCEPISPAKFATDRDQVFEIESEVPHHHLEVAVLAVLGSPFDAATLDAMVDDIRPDFAESYVVEGDTFADGSMKPSFCLPVQIEVSSEDSDNNIWVIRRFRVDDAESSNFDEMMTEFWALTHSVRERVLS